MFISRRKALLMLGASTVLAAPAIKAAPKAISFRISGDLPRSSFDDENRLSGFEVDITRRMADHAGPDVNFSYVPSYNWTRSLKNIEFGELGAMAGVSWREERESYMDYCGVMDTEEIFLVTRQEMDVPLLDNIDKLAGFNRKIQVNFDAAWGPEFDRRLEEDPDYAKHFVNISGSVYDYREFTQNTARRVMKGRVDGAIAVYYSVLKMVDTARKEAADRSELLKVTPIPAFGAPPTYVILSRKLPEDLRASLHEGYRKVREEGFFEETWRRWYPGRRVPDDIKV